VSQDFHDFLADYRRRYPEDVLHVTEEVSPDEEVTAILAALEAPAGAELRDRGRAAARYVRRFPFAVALSAIGALVVLVLGGWAVLRLADRATAGERDLRP